MLTNGVMLLDNPVKSHLKMNAPTLTFIIGSTFTTAIIFFLGRKRSKFFRYFTGFFAGTHTLLSALFFALTDFPLIPTWVYFYLQICFFVFCYLRLFAPKLRLTLHLHVLNDGRPFWFQICINYPGMWFLGASCFSIPIAHIYYIKPELGVVIAFILSSIALYHSLFNHSWDELIHIDLTDQRESVSELQRIIPNPPQNFKKELKIFQLTDTHIGSVMSVNRLKKICEKIVQINPDLVVLTGDFYTVESNRNEEALSNALEPLKALKGKCFACLGVTKTSCSLFFLES